MKTQKTKVEGTLYVFAEAKSNWQLKELEPGELPFDYVVRSYDYGHEGAVRLLEQPVVVEVPAGIDITMKCIENLKEQVEATRKKRDKEIKDLEDRIRALALIEYKPEVSLDDA